MQVYDKTDLVLNWSSGKDAALAYELLRHDSRYQVRQLLTTLNAEAGRVFMHGTREALLDRQAQCMGLPLTKIKLPPASSDILYKDAMQQTLTRLQQDGIAAAAFGDIFLDDLRQYREAQLHSIGMQAVFPLWQQDTRQLVVQLEQRGIEAIVICVNAGLLGRELLGRRIDTDFLSALPDGVDPCGENGEFHTLVTNAPFFSEPLQVQPGETVLKEYKDAGAGWDNAFYFLDVLLR